MLVLIQQDSLYFSVPFGRSSELRRWCRFTHKQEGAHGPIMQRSASQTAVQIDLRRRGTTYVMTVKVAACIHPALATPVTLSPCVLLHSAETDIDPISREIPALCCLFPRSGPKTS